MNLPEYAITLATAGNPHLLGASSDSTIPIVTAVATVAIALATIVNIILVMKTLSGTRRLAEATADMASSTRTLALIESEPAVSFKFENLAPPWQEAPSSDLAVNVHRKVQQQYIVLLMQNHSAANVDAIIEIKCTWRGLDHGKGKALASGGFYAGRKTWTLQPRSNVNGKPLNIFDDFLGVSEEDALKQCPERRDRIIRLECNLTCRRSNAVESNPAILMKQTFAYDLDTHTCYLDV